MTKTGSGKVRILEIDDHPRHIPDEVKEILAPVVDEQQAIGARSGITLKAGELYDADYPSDHSSYFVMLHLPAGSNADPAAQAILDTVTAFCRRSGLPVIEISMDHPEYPQYLAEAAFV